LELVLHLDRSLLELVAHYGIWVYGILFLIVFCETGLVVTPFLPGDSLLFAAGAVAAAGSLNLLTLILLLALAAILGDAVNYSLGSTVVSRFLLNLPFVRREHLGRAESFYRRHGGKAVVLARFAPLLRTFVPFVAGLSAMDFRRFFVFNVVGGLAWVASCSLAGYFFANIPAVKENFSTVVIAIVFVSLVPFVIETVRHARSRRAAW
jgi:membrane-associated protein